MDQAWTVRPLQVSDLSPLGWLEQYQEILATMGSNAPHAR